MCPDPKLRSIFHMKIEGLDIPGTFEISNLVFEDSRGNFGKIYSEEAYREAGLDFTVKQANVSRNLKKATVRGIHFQSAPFMESKIVTCLSGEAFDVMVDLRPSSKTFGNWQSVILKASSNGVFIPAGVAHGFQTLSDNCVIHYLHSENYNPLLSRGLRYNDDDVAVKWPMDLSEISKNDLMLPSFAELRGQL